MNAGFLIVMALAVLLVTAMGGTLVVTVLRQVRNGDLPARHR
ncbi:hypothetical protein [Thermoactinospora rubra]|nr:hypothetical protein [Thermoactinospora rubra]